MKQSEIEKVKIWNQTKETSWMVRNNGRDNVNKPSPNDDQWTSKYQSRKFLNIIKHDLKPFKRNSFLNWMKIKKTFTTLWLFENLFRRFFCVVFVVDGCWLVVLFCHALGWNTQRFQWIITIRRLALFWSFNFGQFQFQFNIIIIFHLEQSYWPWTTQRNKTLYVLFTG